MDRYGHIIIITGMPASGKSTVARKLSAFYKWPILEKDDIKEELFDTIGFKCYSEKRKLDEAATAVLIRCVDSVLRGGNSLICVNNFRQKDADRLLKTVMTRNGQCVFLVFCGNNDIFYERYVARDIDVKNLRHPGHIVQDHYPLTEGESPLYSMTRNEFFEKFEKLGMDAIHVDCKKIEVNATEPGAIDLDSLIKQINDIFNMV